MNRTGATLPPFGLTGWSADRLVDPYPVYHRYRAASPVHPVPDPTAPDAPPTHYVLGHAEVVRVLGDPAYGRSAHRARGTGPAPDGRSALRDLVENWLVFLDPPRHTRLRSVVNREFTPAVVTDLRERIRAIATDLLRDLTATARREGVVDLVEEFAAPFPILVISALLGVPSEDWPWLRDRAVDVQQASSSRAAHDPAAPRRADAAARELTAYFLDLAAHRRTEPGPDLVSLLVTARPGGRSLNDTETVATCVHLMTAGHETTTNTLAKSVLALAARPESWAALRRTPRIPPSAVDELVRFDPPVQAVTRWAYRDLTLGGHPVPRGSKVVALLGAANRDPARFPEPDALRLDRRGRHVSFGLGIHYCLGAALARTEIEIGLGLLLAALDGLGGPRPSGTLAVDEVTYPYDLVFHGPSRLTLRLDPAATPGPAPGPDGR
ncbi:cytochrome P450 [Streptomyces sp. NPDC049906]|uniref:cytochrome P450 n=1 Tax=Streptomyces sp. NPDC049906 TaxID=3155656 RepID=UPI00343E9E92